MPISGYTSGFEVVIWPLTPRESKKYVNYYIHFSLQAFTHTRTQNKKTHPLKRTSPGIKPGGRHMRSLIKDGFRSLGS
jgi:hypothetical protein